jgi:hypothetical protein
MKKNEKNRKKQNKTQQTQWKNLQIYRTMHSNLHTSEYLLYLRKLDWK